MLFPARHRYHPRSQQDNDRKRRDAALRAQVADLAEHVMALEQEQQVQLKRIAEIQQQLDTVTKLLKQLVAKGVSDAVALPSLPHIDPAQRV